MASRHYVRTANDVSITCWLVFTAQGGARLTRDEPELKPGERAVHVTAKLPLALFREPTLSAQITVNDDQARNDTIAKVEHNASKVLKERLGLDLKLTINEKTAK